MAGNPRGNFAVTLKNKLIHLPGILVLFSNLVHACICFVAVQHCSLSIFC